MSSSSSIQNLVTKNTVETVFAVSPPPVNNTQQQHKKPLPSSNFPVKVVAEDTTRIPPGKGYTLSFEHALCVGRYTPDPSGAPVTKAVAPNRTTSAISVSEAEEAFKLGTDAISKMILVPPQSTTAKKNLVDGDNNTEENTSNNNDDDEEKMSSSLADNVNDNASASQSSPSNPGTPVTPTGNNNVSTLLSSMFRAAQISSEHNKKISSASASANNKNKTDEPPLTSYALSTKEKNVRTPPQNVEALQETTSYSVFCHSPNLNIPATVFFPVSYDWPRRRAAPDAVSPLEINKRDHAPWPPTEYLSMNRINSTGTSSSASSSSTTSSTTTTFCEIKTKKYNANTTLLYRIGPGAVAFRVVSNAFEAAGMTYTPGGCYDHIDYNDTSEDSKPPIESSSTSASWNVLWAKRCDPIVLSQMNSFQKINHLPGSWSIGRKDNLHKCIQRLQKQHGIEEFGEIAPRSFIYPTEMEDLAADVVRSSTRVRKPPPKKKNTAATTVSYRTFIRYGPKKKDPKTGEEYEEEEEFEEEEEASNEEEEEEQENDEKDTINDAAQPDINDDRYYETIPGLYIVKPCASSCGNGIRVCRGMPKFPKPGLSPDGQFIRPQRSYVVQRYLEPFIVDERKFDLRLYVVLTGVNPLKIWLFDEGLVRFAAHKYTPDDNLENSRIHLTNFSIGKDEKKKKSGGAAADDEDGEIKWTITDFKKHFLESPEIIIPPRYEHLKNNRPEILRQVQSAIDQVVVKTVMCMENDVRTECRKQCRDPTGRGCFEMFGVDVMLNSDLKPHVIEANIMPSLAATLDLDRAVKGRMLAHMLSMIGVVPFCRDQERSNPTPPLGAFVPGVESGPASGFRNDNNNDNNDESTLATTTTGTPLEKLPMYVYTHENASNKITTEQQQQQQHPLLHYQGGVNVPLLTDFNDPKLITEAERLMLAEAEAEVASSGGFRRIYPDFDSHEKYSHLFSHGLCRNTYLLLSYAVAKHNNKDAVLLKR